MRTLRLATTFDAVFVHDAVCYITTEEDLRAVADTAFVHTRPGAPPCSRPTWCARPSGKAPTSSPASAAAGPCAASSGWGPRPGRFHVRRRIRLRPPRERGRPPSITSSTSRACFPGRPGCARWLPRALSPSRRRARRKALGPRFSWLAGPDRPVESLWISCGNRVPVCGFRPAFPVDRLRISGGKHAPGGGWAVPGPWKSSPRVGQGLWTACG